MTVSCVTADYARPRCYRSLFDMT